MEATKGKASSTLKRGSAHSQDPAQAVADLRAQIGQEKPALTTIFAAPNYDRALLATEIARAFSDTDTPIVGCTTAGEINERGFGSKSLTGFSLGAEDFTAVSALLDLSQMESAQSVVEGLDLELRERIPGFTTSNCFAFLLVDGLSVSEEEVTYKLQSALGEIDLVGGSAGDGLAFETTFVYANGQFHSGAAVLTLVHTERPFHVFKTQHFEATDKKLVVTAADGEKRVVHEINGAEAASEYARTLGVEVSELTPELFARNPVMVRMGGSWFARSIQKANEDGSLTAYCAIDEGLVLTIGRGLDFAHSLREAFDRVRSEIGDIVFTLGFDCILRRLEVEGSNLESAVNPVLTENCVVGFHTYGEQFGSTHVNQTFTGVAIA